MCGDIPCFDAITDIYISSVAESGAAVEVTMKGYKNGSFKSVTKSGRNIKSQLGFTSHYFKTSSTSDISTLNVGPITVSTTSTTTTDGEVTTTTGDTAQYATSTQGLSYLSKAGLINKCLESSTACQAKILTREEAAAVVAVVGGIPLDSPNAYSDDDQSIYRFQGAYPEIFRDFMKSFKGAKMILLKTNYRNIKSVVELSSWLLKQDLARSPKQLVSDKKSKDKVSVVSCDCLLYTSPSPRDS